MHHTFHCLEAFTVLSVFTHAGSGDQNIYLNVAVG
jgi:hypothetical protein